MADERMDRNKHKKRGKERENEQKNEGEEMTNPDEGDASQAKPSLGVTDRNAVHDSNQSKSKRMPAFKVKSRSEIMRRTSSSSSSEPTVNGPVGLSDMTRIAGGKEWIHDLGLSVREGFRIKKQGKRESGEEGECGSS